MEGLSLTCKTEEQEELSPLSVCSAELILGLSTLFLSLNVCISDIRLPWPPEGLEVGSGSDRSDVFLSLSDVIPARRSPGALELRDVTEGAVGVAFCC